MRTYLYVILDDILYIFACSQKIYFAIDYYKFLEIMGCVSKFCSNLFTNMLSKTLIFELKLCQLWHFGVKKLTSGSSFGEL